MKEWNRERVELHMLISLARSQRALCRIIESVADHVENSEQLAGHVADNLKSISDYQHALMLKLTKQSTRKRVNGKPAKPWLNKNV
ncbi:hypothetical protein PAECIP111891_06574 [Paenibacillus allorhizoplanae]|uniref:Uncharacterized protein n=1 Tax=Paenibacillus allorhizoplanae TaxID=2905648 RepID=A0ABM9CYC4_9BACL|nr:hypothetical protein [Paenibacillus allorhizoplanae]CAH1229922.1 hypothetical protein PAECIP111891_06574 [Paenibacillus allorhizoplanae]